MNRYAVSAVPFGQNINTKCIYKERLQINGYTITSIGEAYTASVDSN